jgi:pyridoxine 5-phosphate synthase
MYIHGLKGSFREDQAMVRTPRVTLLINIDHIATLRNARGGFNPDPLAAGRICLRAGADGIVCHLREDRRHIRDDDVKRLRKHLRSKLDLEMAATEEIVSIALKTKPDLVTLVPERRKELTTEGGLDVVRKRRTLKRIIMRFHEAGIPVSLFVDPDEAQVEASEHVGADIIEIHTGEYADASTPRKRKKELKRIRHAAEEGAARGLRIHAGHGLDYKNTRAIVALPQMREVSIGYAIIARAIDVGLYTAVKDMASLIRTARP